MSLRIRAQPRPVAVSVRPAAPQRARDRVRQALTCPYCRDQVGGLNAAACARPGCGAVYHRDCWDECLADYGACAVFGCACREVQVLGHVGWLVRFLRLALAALLFPPRLVEALTQEDSRERRALWERIRADATIVHEKIWTEAGPRAPWWHGLTSLLQFVICVGLIGGVALGMLRLGVGSESAWTTFGITVWAWAPLGTLGIMWCATLGLVGAKSVLLGEFAALGRADRGGTVLARMRAGGKKA